MKYSLSPVLSPPGSFPGLTQPTGNSLTICALHSAQAICPSLAEASPPLTALGEVPGVGGGVGIARPRDRLTFAHLAAGCRQREGCGAAWFWAGHETTVDLALLTEQIGDE